jgi:hypothetical protein
MLTKQTGASKVVTATATTQTVTISANDDSLPVRKVRIATNSNPVLVAFNTTTNLNIAGILVPGNSAEHFTLEGSTKITIIRGSTSTDALVSITSVA